MTKMDLAHYKMLRQWSPQIGDFVIYHGWFTHYFGVISAIYNDDYMIDIIKKGMPILLLGLTPEEHDKNKTKVHIGTIKGSTGGKYAVVRAEQNNLIWFI